MYDNTFYWTGIGLIITGIFFSFIYPRIIHYFPHTKIYIKPFMFWYHVIGVMSGIYLTWLIYES